MALAARRHQDVGVRTDYGDVTSEYRALRSATGYVTGNSELVWVRGPDSVDFLDGQLSQDVVAMPVGTTARSFLLEPKGKLSALAWVLRGDSTVGLVVDAGRGEQVIDRLARFRFRVDADVALDDADVLEVWGPDCGGVAEQMGIAAGTGWSTDGRVTTALLDGGVLERFVVAGVGAEVLEDAGFSPAGRVAADSVRIEAGEPVMGVDVDEGTIPQETGLAGAAVSFTKGCYVGQELVARIDSRGHVNQRLVGVEIATNVVPPRGAEVVSDGRAVGVVSTVGESLALRAPVALARVRTEVADGDEIRLRWDGGEVAARVRDLPMDDLSGRSHSSYTAQRD